MPSISSELRELEPPGLGRELRRVGVGTDARRLEAPGAGDDEAARTAPRRPASLSSGSLSPVSSDSSTSSPSACAHDAVARDLVAGAQHEQVVEHDAPRPRSPTASPSRDHPRARRVQHREPVERALRPHLLHDADERVGDEHDAERRVLDRARPRGSPRASMPRIALNRVNTFARTISPSVRLVRSPVSLTCPRATRSATSAGGQARRRCLRCRGGADVAGSDRLRHRRNRRGHPVTDAQELDGDERDLTGGVVFEHPEPAELGEALAALVGARRDQLVAGFERTSCGAGRGSGRRGGSRAGSSRSRARARASASVRPSRNEPGDTGTRTITSSLSPSAIASTGCISSPSSTSHTICLRGVAELLGRATEVEQPRNGDGSTCSAALRSTHTSSRSRISSRRSSRLAHLGREALVVEQQRGVREPDRDLRHVLHLHEHVDGTVEVGDAPRGRRRYRAGATRARRRARAARRCRRPGRGG